LPNRFTNDCRPDARSSRWGDEFLAQFDVVGQFQPQAGTAPTAGLPSTVML